MSDRHDPPSVLVVDDQADLRRAIRRVLERAGFAVSEAGDGRAAARMFRRLGPDLVLLDILMPRHEGIEAIVEIRETCPGARILAMSGGGNFDAGEVLRLAELLGATGTLRKPFGNAELLAAIRRCLPPPRRLSAAASAGCINVDPIGSPVPQANPIPKS